MTRTPSLPSAPSAPSVPSRSLRQELGAPLRGRTRVLVRLVLWSLVEALPAFLTGQLVARAVDSGFAAGRPWAGLGWLGLMGAGIFAGSWGTRQVYPLLAGIVEPYRDDLVGRVVGGALRRAVAGHGPAGTSGVSRLTQQVEMVRESYAGLVMGVRRFVFTVAAALVGLLLLSPLVLALVLPPLLAGVLLFALLIGRMAERQRDLILADEQVAEAAGTLAAGVRDVVACGAEEQARETLGRRVEAQALAARRLAALMPVRTLALALGGWLPVLLLLGAAPWLTRNGVSSGAVMGAVTYVLQSLQPALRTLVQGLGGSGLRLVVALRRILETAVDAPGTGQPGKQAPGSTPAPTSAPAPAPEKDRPHAAPPDGHRLSLRSVSFGYGARSQPLIRGLDLVVEEGGHVAVVGPSGIGKSTLAGLMTGMLVPDSGEIRLAGAPTAGRSGPELARSRVLIPQEAYVFAGTVHDNLAYLRPGASAAELDDAVAALGLEPLIGRLGGYRARISAAGLSAGERQQIALARAYLSPAPLVVLDEATCHLDPAAEARAEEAFARRPGALVVVAHRISSALRARSVLLMDGTDVLHGSHDELLRRSALYRDLVGHWQEPPPSDPRDPGDSGDPVDSQKKQSTPGEPGPVRRPVRASPPRSRS
ncbi:ATP-binding cassette domain-containing protein [Streptomyces sp. NPDC056987]|uniref:ATP-binding cassette domain-containing protein n=1 Tax=Streptomyces sp. NPDC056987 TaxID=3345988 RepID=UPI00362FB305